MRRFLILFAALSASCVTTTYLSGRSTINYGLFRYSGFGEADAQRDKRIVEAFTRMLDAREAQRSKNGSTFRSAESPASRQARIAELTAQVTQTPTNHAEELRLRARRAELESLLRSPSPTTNSKAEPMIGENVTVLVDTLPDGVELHDGRFSSSADVLILGHFKVVPAFDQSVKESLLVDEMRVLGAAAGGNIVVLSFIHSDEDQGECRGAVGLVILQAAFDPKKVTRGRILDAI